MFVTELVHEILGAPEVFGTSCPLGGASNSLGGRAPQRPDAVCRQGGMILMKFIVEHREMCLTATRNTLFPDE
jgi:hypothetical protein